MIVRTMHWLVGRFAFLFLIGLIAATISQAGGASPTASPASFFPLTVGNSWWYRCGTEGEAHFEKNVTVISRGTGRGGPYFKLEQRVGDKKLTFYLIDDEWGNILRSMSPDADKSRIVAARQMKIGEHYGEDLVTREQIIVTPATGPMTALVVENFIPDDPNLAQDKRNEWHGRFFVNGIGLVSEGDGLGGDCTLIRYLVK